jgi:hypothetical protein
VLIIQLEEQLRENHKLKETIQDSIRPKGQSEKLVVPKKKPTAEGNILRKYIE